MKNKSYFFLAFLIIFNSYAFANYKQLNITHGHIATAGQFPWQAQINIGNYLCGGIIIANQWVLTAAHCLYGRKDLKTTILLGSLNLNQGSEYTASKIKINPNYNANKRDGDIALIKLNKPITKSAEIQPIKLPSASTSFQNGDLMQVSGWGVTETGKPSQELRYARLTYIDWSICKTIWTKALTNNMICAGSVSQMIEHPCNGDSGGALIQKKDNLLAGIASWGIKVCTASIPTVYVKVSNYVNWMHDVMKTNA